MLNFLRKLRRNEKLPSLEGQGVGSSTSTRYLKYAFGEIFLVVVGILIALGINNWNQERLKTNQAKAYLINHTDDLTTDTLVFSGLIADYRLAIDKISQPLINKKYQNLPLDSIATLLTNHYSPNTVVDQTYQKIKNSGLSDQVGSETLNRAINNYYALSIKGFNEFIEFDAKYTMEDYVFSMVNEAYEFQVPENPASVNVSSFHFVEDETTRKKALINRIQSNLGRNHIRSAVFRKGLGVERTQETKKKATALIELINKELKSN